MSIMVLISGLAAYIIFLLLLCIGWLLTKPIPLEKPDYQLYYSIVIPFRNEMANLPQLLDSLTQLHFPKSHYEIILVNDHSTDDFQFVLDTYDRLDFRIEYLRGASGKKEALRHGIATARGDVIITTDADCWVPPTWLITYAQCFEKNDIKMAFGGVTFRKTHEFFKRIQQMEFVSLIGSGAATLKLGFPSMCNGANLGFLKSVYQEVGGYSDNLQVPSGDDEFLMHKIYKRFGSKVAYIKNTNSVVFTEAQESVGAFFQQRKRWASKWKAYASIKNSLLAVGVLLCQILILAAWGFVVLGFGNLTLLGLLFAKSLIEAFFLFRVSQSLGNKFYLLSFIILQIGYPFYVVLFGLTANFGHYKWKGRKHRL